MKILPEMHLWTLASCLIYARALLEYVIIMWWQICNHYVVTFCYTMLPSMDFAEEKVLVFFILREKC